MLSIKENNKTQIIYNAGIIYGASSHAIELTRIWSTSVVRDVGISLNTATLS